MTTVYVCLPCLLEQTHDEHCARCDQQMTRGSLCIGCGMELSVDEGFGLGCLADHVANGVITVEELPEALQRAVSDAAADAVAAREHRRIKAVELARAETLALLAMVARAPIDGAGWLRVRQAV
jgi:hypothetical protein